MPKSLTIRSFLPQREVEICQRLRDVRIGQKLEQVEFAEHLGITRSRLSSYEYAKAPIRYELGKEVCYRFNVNQRWLATGAKPPRPYFDLSPNLEFRIKPKTLFSTVFDDVLDSAIKDREQELRNLIGDDAFYSGDYEPAVLDSLAQVGELPSKALSFYVAKAILVKLHWLPDGLQFEYGKLLIRVEKEFQKKYGKQFAKTKPPAQRRMSPIEELKWNYGEGKKSNGQDILDITERSDKTTGVHIVQTYGELLGRLRKITKPHGVKAELARHFKVSRQAVDQWLSGESKPSAEIAIELQHWKPEQPKK